MLQGSFVLDADDACHVLTVETGGPISSVALQSNVLLDLQECSVAILSLSPPDPSNRSMTLATYRCHLHGQTILFDLMHDACRLQVGAAWRHHVVYNCSMTVRIGGGLGMAQSSGTFHL